MTSEHLHQIRTVRSYACEKEVFIRDIKGIENVPSSCPNCHAEFSVEFLISQEGMAFGGNLTTHVIMLLCEVPACQRVMALRWMTDGVGDFEVQQFTNAQRVYNLVMDRFENDAAQRERHYDQMSHHDDAHQR